MKYDKLVRDNIPDVIRGKGGTPVVHVAGEAEYWEKLKEKLAEEVAEFALAESVEELADVLEVIDAIREYKRFDPAEIEAVKNKKAVERGRFVKRIILDES